MTLETFFEKFDQFSEAPNAVAKMRELVLVLAVRGKLVPQETDDEPAVALLTRAVKARRELVAAKIVRAEAPDLTFLEGSRVPLPVGWVAAPLGVYAGVIMGQSPPSSSYNQDGRGLPFYQGKSQFGQLYPQANHWCTEPTKVGESGDVVISVRAPVGPTNMLREKSCLGRGLTALRGLGGNQMYLLYALRAFEKQIAALGVGSTFVAISKSDLDNFFLPIPPLAEQKRIVAKVDELMALCDRLEAQQQERDTRRGALARASLARFADAPTPANLNFLFHDSYAIEPADLRKTILTLAVQGRLVPQDPDDKPAANLIQHIGEERRLSKAKQYSPLGPDEAPYEVPESWSWIRLGNISLGSEAGWSPQCEPQPRSGDDWGVLKVSAVSWGKFLPEENKALPMGLNSRPHSEVRPGDFLLSRANTEDLVARSVVVTDTPPRLMMSDKIVRFIFPDLVDKDFINLANSSDFARSYYARNASGTSSSMKNVSREVMRNLPIPLPPLSEQRRIVAKVDQLMALVDQLEAQLAAARSTATKLMNAMVAALTVEN